MTQETALKILQTGANVFLTGEPGSGKTHTVNLYVRWLREHNIEPAITASTGIAATHIGGITIHSWSGIGIKTALGKHDILNIAANERVIKRIRRTNILIIDEVSMMPADTLNMVETVCHTIRSNPKPFGGLQVVFVGDFFQLPPIVREQPNEDGQVTLTERIAPRFAYDALAWTKINPTACYLTEQHRQDDAAFLGVLSAIRRNEFGADHLRHIAGRRIEHAAAPKHAPKLFSHNADVDRINAEMLEELPGDAHAFTMSSHGAQKIAETLVKNCLSPELLLLKVGAAVMFTKNSPKDGFVNGTLGAVAGFNSHNGWPIVQTRGAGRIEVEPMDWTIMEGERVLARITQVPLRLAWAITVHKSQGMSLDEAVMDLSNVFEFGQGYVALSRVRRLTGLHLLGWNDRTFQVHPEVLAKDAEFRAASDEASRVFNAMPNEESATAHKNFILACGGNPTSHETKKYETIKTKQPTIAVTLSLLKSGKTIAEIAGIRNLALTTISAHITDLYAKGDIGRPELTALISPALKNALPEIHTAFREIGRDRLSPIFQHLRGKYSFDDLRFARLLLDEEK